MEMHFDACQCCLSRTNLKNMFEKFSFGAKQEIYSEMIFSCFSIKISSYIASENISYFICGKCITQLRDCLFFRKQVEYVQSKLKGTSKEKKIIADQDGTNFSKNQFETSDDFDCDNDEVFTEIGNNTTIFDSKLLTDSPPKKMCNMSNNINEDVDTKNMCLSTNKTLLSEEFKLSKNKDEHKRMKDKVKRKKYNVKKWYSKAFTSITKAFPSDKSTDTCEICKETFSNHIKLLSHKNIHYPNFVCDKCGKLFACKINLKSHIKNVHESKMITCQLCNKSLKESSLLRHIRSHSGVNFTSTCLFCPKKFVSHNTRIRHMKNIHKYIGKEYKCKLCPKRFLVSGDLSKHIRKLHLLEKKHSCTECNDSFFAMSCLRNHMIKHGGEKNFQCQICLKSYARRKTLVQHIKIHDNIKDYVCIICGRAFTQKCVLQSHMKTHKKKKLFTISDDENQRQ